MKILINATSLVERGSLSLIKDMIDQLTAKEDELVCQGIFIHILVSLKELVSSDCPNIVIEYEPFPKQSLFKRLYYERCHLPNKLKHLQIEAYLSLQHVSLLKKGLVPQFVLIHNSLHLSSLMPGELEWKLFIKYRILMNTFTRLTIHNYDGIFVQTHWVKNALKAKYGYAGDIKVIRPALRNILQCQHPLSQNIAQSIKSEHIKLLYITRPGKYKNHERLIEAVHIFNDISQKEKVLLLLTLEGKSNESIRYLGNIPYDTICNLYQQADALIFPSLSETLGLPLMEAALFRLPVLAADLPYAREVCGEEAIYFDPRDEASIIQAIAEFATNGSIYKRHLKSDPIPENSSYYEYIEAIKGHLKKR